jgi:hypothetical protein
MNYLLIICRSFSTARAVFHHAYSAHVKYSSDYVCLWNECERQKWTLISHIQMHPISSSIYFIVYVGTALLRGRLSTSKTKTS